MDNWLDFLERKFGRWSIPRLPLIIVVGHAAVYLLSFGQPELINLLTFSAEDVFAGQIWRLFTYLFIPPATHPFFIIFWLYLIYIYASGLEHEWGEFRFSLFYAIVAICISFAGLVLGGNVTNVPLNTSLFLAFAAVYPDFELMLFFFLPVKVKYLAWLGWLGIVYALIAGTAGTRIAVSASLINYMLFFSGRHWEFLQLKFMVYRNRRRFFKDQ